MKCGNCGNEMEDGRAEVHGTFLGFLAFGFSLQDLYWYGRDNVKQRVIGSGRGRPAWVCKPCGFLTIDARTEADSARRRR